MNPLQVQLVTGSVSRLSGGLFHSVRGLARGLGARPGLSAGVLGVADEHSAADLPQWEGIPVQALPVRGPARFGYTPELVPQLEALQPDLVHTQFLWSYPSIAVARWAWRTGRPYLVSPRGMLDPWALAHSALKKRLAGRLFERGSLAGAACLHALCEEERQSMRDYGLTNPVCVIPNGVTLPAEGPDRQSRQAPFTLLFLGRLHPKKGLEPLLRAWSAWREADPATADDWRLTVAGWDDGGHAADLRQWVRELGLEAIVSFAGPVEGEAKAILLQEADAFVLPSFSEGLPMAVLEAWAAALPVMMTDACHLPEGFSSGAAWRIQPERESITEGLRHMAALSPGDRAAMGRKGRRLVEDHFSWDRIAARMHEVYHWVRHGGPVPEGVDV